MSRQFNSVKKGTKGIDVYVLQSFFRANLYTGKNGKPIEIDGESGDNTVYAINTFKKLTKAYGMNCGEPDGVWNKECWIQIGLMEDTGYLADKKEKIYEWAVKTCNDKNVGYSQEYRNERTVNGITYYDCSSFVYYALCYAGFALDKTAWPFTTYTMQDVLKNLGFKEYDSKSVEWKKSDIMWNQEHTEIVYKGTGKIGEGYTMGAHGKTNRTLENQVSINSTISSYGKYPKLYRYE